MINKVRLQKQKPVTIWLTGLSGAGKSTIARTLENGLLVKEKAVYVLDGDILRKGLSRDLGFSPEDRKENIRRVAEVSRLLNDAGLIVIVALISPYRIDRESAKDIIGADRFIEIYVKASLEICEQRDPKGLYKKARAGLIAEFTGLTAPYEEPSQPQLVLETAREDVMFLTAKVMDHLKPYLEV